jgi:hypothetical protein
VSLNALEPFLDEVNNIPRESFCLGHVLLAQGPELLAQVFQWHLIDEKVQSGTSQSVNTLEFEYMVQNVLCIKKQYYFEKDVG